MPATLNHTAANNNKLINVNPYSNNLTLSGEFGNRLTSQHNQTVSQNIEKALSRYSKQSKIQNQRMFGGINGS